MSRDKFLMHLNLQLFADGDGGTGAEGATGVSVGDPGLQGGDLSSVKYGIQDEATAQPKAADDTDRVSKFEALIKGEYKDLYDARVKDTVTKRLKNTQEIVDKYNKLDSTLDLLSKKYGVDKNDADAISKAIEEDDSYFEDEALEKGITVDQLKSIRKMERENAELKKQMQEKTVKENADRIYAGWMQQADSLKGVYPSFDLEKELGNPQFINLIKNNVDLRTAFEVLHKDEIIPAAMQFTAQQVERKITNKVMANASRPTENGMGSASSAIVKSDVSQLSKEDRAEIIRRVQRGEKIRF